jgi:hypothetical protein
VLMVRVIELRPASKLLRVNAGGCANRSARRSTQGLRATPPDDAETVSAEAPLLYGSPGRRIHSRRCRRTETARCLPEASIRGQISIRVAHDSAYGSSVGPSKDVIPLRTTRPPTVSIGCKDLCLVDTKVHEFSASAQAFLTAIADDDGDLRLGEPQLEESDPISRFFG